MFAVKQGRVAVVKTLVENGRADVNLEENVSSKYVIIANYASWKMHAGL